MSKTVLQLKELRTTKQQEWDAVLSAAETEGRELTDDESDQVIRYHDEIKDLDGQIAKAEKLAEARKAHATRLAQDKTPMTEEREIKRIKEKYSFARTFKSLLRGNVPNDGVEGEMQKEAEHEARGFSQSIGGAGVPSSFIDLRKRNHHTRTTLTVGTDATAGYLVDTELDSVVDVLRPNLQVVDLGAEVRQGLSADYSFPRKTTASTFGWAATENASAAETNPIYELVTMAPKRISGFIPVSRQLRIQSDANIEADLRAGIERGVATTLDAGAINGSGSSGQPTGILNISGIGDVAGGTNGLAPTWNHMRSLRKELAVDNVMMENIAWLTNPDMQYTLSGVQRFSGTDGRALLLDNSTMLGYPVAISTQVPDDLDKGTSTGVCSAIIIGNWSEAVIAQWGGLDLIVDEYTTAKTSIINFVVHMWADFNVRHKESFAAMQDALEI